jgi:hypothetical protein
MPAMQRSGGSEWVAAGSLVSISDQCGQNKSIPQAALGSYPYQRAIDLETAMNHQPAFPLASAVIDDFVVGPCRALRSAASALLVQWRDDARRRRESREFDAIVGNNVALLKDIGAPCWMVARAVERKAATDPWLVQLGAAR